ncbi:hypothetical protein KJ059_18850 [Myxococcota bacterium]|nr:hypothetical protein [Myxococcota bacterium]MCZ7617199.1 hypothetical protein [Myxococcota bacterium]
MKEGAIGETDKAFVRSEGPVPAKQLPRLSKQRSNSDGVVEGARVEKIAMEGTAVAYRGEKPLGEGVELLDGSGFDLDTQEG